MSDDLIHGLRSLTIALCTLNREADLERCVQSIIAANPPDDSVAIEVLVIDDGCLPEIFLRKLERAVSCDGRAFGYLRNRAQHGLMQSRLTAIRNAVSDVLLFLDDDVEIDPDYLRLLVAWYREHPETAGVGGVDLLTRELPTIRRLFARLFLQDSGLPGRLSPSGFSRSMARWESQRFPFTTEFLSGCNMSFRREVLQGVTFLPWLEGYSLGEDLYLSLVAAERGPLWVNPALRVWHHRSPASRTSDRALSYVAVANPYHLLRLRKAGRWGYLALIWTTIGLILRDAVRPSRWRLVPGYCRGLREIARGLASQSGKTDGRTLT